MALACTAGVLGCLTPQDIELWEEPLMPNLPPIIDLMAVSPNEAVVCVSEVDEVPVEFRVSNVRDANGVEGQVLFARWFVDYSPDRALTTAIVRSDELVPQEEGSEVYTPVVLTADALRPLTLTDGPHTVEVVISDGFAAGAVEPKNRAVKHGYYSATYKWSINYQVNRTCD